MTHTVTLITGTIYRIDRDPADYAQDCQNPLFVNRHTGECVFQPSYYQTRDYHEEHTHCPICGQAQQIYHWQSPLYQIERVTCGCPMQLTINPVLAIDPADLLAPDCQTFIETYDYAAY